MGLRPKVLEFVASNIACFLAEGPIEGRRWFKSGATTEFNIVRFEIDLIRGKSVMGN
jgi:hypothetical protein